MHIRIRHDIIHSYAEPPKAANRKLLLTPRNYQGQHVQNWRIDLDHNCRLRQGEDAFGNVQHCYSVDGPFDRLVVSIEGEVDTFDTAGVVKGAVERFPMALYLRDTPLGAADPELRAYAQEASAHEAELLSKLHALLGALHDDLGPVREDAPVEGAAAAFARRSAGTADQAHIFIACAREIGAPARFVSGFLCVDDAAPILHGWAEAYVDTLGWVGFDVGACSSPAENYLRIAAALDSQGAAPLKSAQAGGGEVVETHKPMIAARRQGQTQSQSQS